MDDLNVTNLPLELRTVRNDGEPAMLLLGFTVEGAFHHFQTWDLESFLAVHDDLKAFPPAAAALPSAEPAPAASEPAPAEPAPPAGTV